MASGTLDGLRNACRCDLGGALLDIFVDADGCPVKQETYRVAKRHGLRVVLVSNSWMRTPEGERFELVVVDGDFDAADDWIVEHVRENDIVVSGDIPLASRCLKKGARVLGPRGREFTDESIGEAIAGRELLSELRDRGMVTKGPEPIDKRDRSSFLQRLEAMVAAVQRGR